MNVWVRQQQSVAFQFNRALPIAAINHIEFAIKYLGEKVTCATGGFKETRIDPLGLMLDQIQHGIDLALAGKYLAMVSHPFF